MSVQGLNNTLMNWDQAYYAQKLQQALFNLTNEDVRPYFAYPTVLDGLHKVSTTSLDSVWRNAPRYQAAAFQNCFL